MFHVLGVMLLLLCLFGLPVSAEVVPYAGVIGGIATLSADAASELSSQGLSASSYSPKNGAALNGFVGLHLNNYFSLQANYIWNRNDLILSSTSSLTDTFYQQARTSSQHAAVLDFLIYFRGQDSHIRPYLGTGGGIIHLSSKEGLLLASGGSPSLPPSTFSSTQAVFRSHVGIDLRLRDGLDFRYSFSEMIGRNEISKHLSPPAPRGLANFQNLFGFVLRF
jgi:hypothetical protein